MKEEIEEEILRHFSECRNEIRDEARKQIQVVQEENRRCYNTRRKAPTTYKVNDIVAIKRTQFGAGLKIHRNYLGPYKVVLVKDNDRYDVVRVGIHEGTSTSVDFMKPYIQDTSSSEAGSDSESNPSDEGGECGIPE